MLSLQHAPRLAVLNTFVALDQGHTIEHCPVGAVVDVVLFNEKEFRTEPKQSCEVVLQMPNVKQMHVNEVNCKPLAL